MAFPAADAFGMRKMSRQIFISYRRDDSSALAQRVYERLNRHFASDQVLREVDDLKYGGEVNPLRAIEKRLRSCDLLIVVIGKRWLISSDHGGRRRIDNPKDFVRMEIETALRRNIPLIPVLTEDASMPEPRLLPGELKSLVRRDAFLIRNDHFKLDSAYLMLAVESVLEHPEKKAPQPSKPFYMPGAPPSQPEERPEPPGHPRSSGKFMPGAPPASQPEERPELRQREENDRLEAVRLELEARQRRELERRRLEAERWSSEAGAYLSLRHWLEKTDPEALLKKTDPGRLLIELASGQFPRTVVVLPAAAAPEYNPVDCTVFAPDRLERKQKALLQVFLHTPRDRERAEASALKFDSGTRERGHQSLVLDAPIGTTFAFDAEIEDFDFPERVGTLLWTGKPQSVAFSFFVPGSCKWGQHIGLVRIWKDGTPVGRISFQIEVVRDSRGVLSRPLGQEARRYHTCFCSYSSLDRIEMLKRAQGLRATGLETFIDVMDLRPGDKWDPKIFAAIDKSDLFVLIWSTNAKNSKWVKRESRYALKRCSNSGSPDFRPIPIEGPPIPAVPRAMKGYHFNDEFLSLLRAAEMGAK
jgi:hypothetical protein